MDDLRAAVGRLLDAIDYATVATVSTAGRPWNSPVYFARDGATFYWISRADAQHSINIRDNGRVFLAVYDSRREDTSGAAAYVEADAREFSDDAEIAAAVTAIYRRKQKPAPPAGAFRAPAAQRVYAAVARQAWTNVVHADSAVPWDERVSVSLGD
jgi:nitroimidazol reductase NimA-like FMN-containing flavoprotein (pyridoxamine 5'-phosphate oxidase superfamily)